MEKMDYEIVLVKHLENLNLIIPELDDEKIKNIIENIINEITLLAIALYDENKNIEEFEKKLKIQTKKIIKKEIFENSISISDFFPNVIKDFVTKLTDIESKVFEMNYLFFLAGDNGGDFDKNEICQKLNISDLEYLQHSLSISVKHAFYFKKLKKMEKDIDKLIRRLDKNKK